MSNTLPLLATQIILVDAPVKLATALQELFTYDRFVIDTEGVNLNRTVQLTVATIQRFQSRNKWGSDNNKIQGYFEELMLHPL